MTATIHMDRHLGAVGYQVLDSMTAFLPRLLVLPCGIRTGPGLLAEVVLRTRTVRLLRSTAEGHPVCMAPHPQVLAVQTDRDLEDQGGQAPMAQVAQVAQAVQADLGHTDRVDQASGLMIASILKATTAGTASGLRDLPVMVALRVLLDSRDHLGEIHMEVLQAVFRVRTTKLDCHQAWVPGLRVL